MLNIKSQQRIFLQLWGWLQFKIMTQPITAKVKSSMHATSNNKNNNCLCNYSYKVTGCPAVPKYLIKKLRVEPT